jgi:hypothetical protein
MDRHGATKKRKYF